MELLPGLMDDDDGGDDNSGIPLFPQDDDGNDAASTAAASDAGSGSGGGVATNGTPAYADDKEEKEALDNGNGKTFPARMRKDKRLYGDLLTDKVRRTVPPPRSRPCPLSKNQTNIGKLSSPSSSSFSFSSADGHSSFTSSSPTPLQ